MSNWMLSSVQKAQISKTSSGTAMLTTGGLSQQNKLPISSLVTEFNDSIKRTTGSPTKMMPFNEFHEMFRNYSNMKIDADAAAQQATGANVNAAASPVGSPHRDSDASAGQQGGAAGLRKKNRRRTTNSGGNPSGAMGSAVDLEGSASIASSNNVLSLDDEGSNLANPVAAKSKGDGTSNNIINSTSMSSNNNNNNNNNNPAHAPTHVPNVEPTNLVKTLAEQDAHFEAYLKIASLPDPSGAGADNTSSGRMRNKLNSAIAPPRRIRKTNPLGQSAVHLMDSRGKAHKDAQKGFSNIFQPKEELQELEDDAGSASGGVSGGASGSANNSNSNNGGVRVEGHLRIKIVTSDDIMGRLNRPGRWYS